MTDNVQPDNAPPITLEAELCDARQRRGDESVGILIELGLGRNAQEVAKRYEMPAHLVRARKTTSRHLVARIRTNPTESLRILGAFTRENAAVSGFRTSHQTTDVSKLSRCCDIATKAVDAARPANKRRTAAPVPPATPPGDVGQALGGAD